MIDFSLSAVSLHPLRLAAAARLGKLAAQGAPDWPPGELSGTWRTNPAHLARVVAVAQLDIILDAAPPELAVHLADREPEDVALEPGLHRDEPLARRYRLRRAPSEVGADRHVDRAVAPPDDQVRVAAADRRSGRASVVSVPSFIALMTTLRTR